MRPQLAPQLQSLLQQPHLHSDQRLLRLLPVADAQIVERKPRGRLPRRHCDRKLDRFSRLRRRRWFAGSCEIYPQRRQSLADLRVLQRRRGRLKETTADGKQILQIVGVAHACKKHSKSVSESIFQ